MRSTAKIKHPGGSWAYAHRVAVAIIAAAAMTVAAANQQPGSPSHTTPRSEDAPVDVLHVAEQMAKRVPPVETDQSPGMLPRAAAAPLSPFSSARLYVLVSFSIPPVSLQKLASQTAAAGVPLVVRGMVAESLSETARRTAELIAMAPGTSVEIDPGPFRRFAITRVPAFLIAAPAPACRTACVPQDAGEVVVGDVTLDYALERLAHGTSASVARHYLDRLRRRP